MEIYIKISKREILRYDDSAITDITKWPQLRARWVALNNNFVTLKDLISGYEKDNKLQSF